MRETWLGERQLSLSVVPSPAVTLDRDRAGATLNQGPLWVEGKVGPGRRWAGRGLSNCCLRKRQRLVAAAPHKRS
jgi:hypothetical protein